MYDTGARRDYPEVLEGVLGPAQKGITFPISFEFPLHVLPVGLGGAEEVDLHRMIDDEVGRHHWVDPVGITAQRLEPIPHGGQVDDARHAGEVLQHDASRQVGDLDLAGGVRAPVRDVAHVLLGDHVVVEVAQRLLEQHGKTPVHGPMIGNLSGNSATVWLRTATPAIVQVEANTLPPMPSGKVSAVVQTRREHDFVAKVVLNGLKPKTQYAYTVTIDGQKNQGAGQQFTTFNKSGEAGKFRLAFGGGAGFVPQHEHVWNSIAATRPDALFQHHVRCMDRRWQQLWHNVDPYSYVS